MTGKLKAAVGCSDSLPGLGGLGADPGRYGAL